MNITYESRVCCKSDVEHVLDIIADSIRLDVVFNPEYQKPLAVGVPVTPPPRASLPQHRLIGIVCYTSMHYVAFFWNPYEGFWTYCDDREVKEVRVISPVLLLLSPLLPLLLDACVRCLVHHAW